jgi:HPr kinase/phosphorylase
MTQTIVHASCVALMRADQSWRAALIIGPAGAGKSSLALELMSRGAWLVADDRTIVRRDEDRLIAACPAAIAGLIEARGIGLIRAHAVADIELALIVDLDATAQDRLPLPHRADLLGVALPRIVCSTADGRASTAHAAAIHLLLRGACAPEPT